MKLDHLADRDGARCTVAPAPARRHHLDPSTMARTHPVGQLHSCRSVKALHSAVEKRVLHCNVERGCLGVWGAQAMQAKW
jgi:hypothetical protein